MTAAGMVLFPGAGTGRDHPSLLVIEDALAPFPVERVDFAFRVAGRRSPPKATTLVGEVGTAATATAERLGVGTERLVLGGRSMGGRVCSMAVAEGLPAAGLVLIAYPLHPPGRPDRPRVEHLPALDVPCLFVSGTRDAFGTPEELEAATATVPGPVTHVWVEGKGHDLKSADRQIVGAIRDWLAAPAGDPPG